MPTVKEVNYYGLDHAAVNKKFTGELTYLRTFTIRGHHWAVYKAANPNRELGHKDYMMLGCSGSGQWSVSGSTPEQMEIERYQDAVLCTSCDTVLYSINRHHYHKCGCSNETMVDGGKDYLRCGGYDMSKIIQVKLDLITGLLVDSPPSENNTVPRLARKPAAKKAKRSQRSEKKR
jgi:hypothetical protein